MIRLLLLLALLSATASAQGRKNVMETLTAALSSDHVFASKNQSSFDPMRQKRSVVMSYQCALIISFLYFWTHLTIYLPSFFIV